MDLLRAIIRLPSFVRSESTNYWDLALPQDLPGGDARGHGRATSPSLTLSARAKCRRHHPRSWVIPTFPKRTAHLAVMGKGHSHLFALGVAYRARQVQIRWIVTG